MHTAWRSLAACAGIETKSGAMTAIITDIAPNRFLNLTA
jgi:hypothetical protein